MQHLTLPHLPAHAGDSTAKIFPAIAHKWACSEAIKTNTSNVTSNQKQVNTYHAQNYWRYNESSKEN